MAARGRGWLWALGAAIFLIPLGLELGYIWQAGLDLHTPDNVRGYLELSRRGRDDIAGKALWTEVRHVDGPLTVLMPGGTGDRDLTAKLSAYLAKQGYGEGDLNGKADLRRRFFEAHAFALRDLQTGTLKTLDGKAHRVVCKDSQRSRNCTLDGLNAYSYFAPFGKTADDGSLYMLGQKPGEAPFLPFLDDPK